MSAGGFAVLGSVNTRRSFRDNKIDADLLPRLTVDDLKDIGVSVVGDRRRLLDAIAALAGESHCGRPCFPAKPAPSKGLQASAERRPITVMFCDLVGSTSLAAQLDAEDWRNLVNAYLDEASAAVTGLGGHVLKKLGDGLMALFGYPHAQENDAERAVRAALAIQRALADLNARNAAKGAPGAFRAHRHRVRAGRGRRQRRGVRRRAEHRGARAGCRRAGLGARHPKRPAPGRRALRRRGEGRATNSRASPDPVQLFRIVRASGGGRRGGARALTPFVGREEELGLLRRRWERARAGEGQLVLIVGEPGLGKSRLVEEFHSRLAETPHTWVEWSASQLLQNTPLHPIAEWGRQRFGGRMLPAEQAPRRPRDDVAADRPRRPANMRPCSRRSSIFRCPRTARPNFAPEELRRRQLAAMIAGFWPGRGRSRLSSPSRTCTGPTRPRSTSLRALAERGAQAPLLLVATTRPEFRAPWSLRSHHSVDFACPARSGRRSHAWSARSPPAMRSRRS